MSLMVGSARIDENGKISGGKPGDQTGNEVSTQPLSILMMECFLVGTFVERVVVGETEQRIQQKELKRR